MSIAIPPRKGLITRKIAGERPDLTPHQVGKLAGTNGGYVSNILKKEVFGRDKPKSRRPEA